MQAVQIIFILFLVLQFTVKADNVLYGKQRAGAGILKQYARSSALRLKHSLYTRGLSAQLFLNQQAQGVGNSGLPSEGEHVGALKARRGKVTAKHGRLLDKATAFFN